MRLIKSVIVSFSMYSKIPMPQFAWEEQDMKYMLCFFPWVGGVIGIFLWLWSRFCVQFGVGTLCSTLIGVLLPLLVTGGFHVDGYMDTMDAFHSYQPREKKLEILKDSHVGAFAVIMLATYGLLYTAAFSEINGTKVLPVFCGVFFLARCLSGISVVSFPTAKKNGMLYSFADHAEKRIVKGSLYVQGVLCSAFLLWQSLAAGGLVIAAAAVSFWYYHHRTKKEFGGITGDTAGYFVLICECSVAVVLAAYWIMMGRG